MGIYNTYTVGQNEFLKANAPLVSRKELTARFNATFGTDRSVSGIKAYCNRNGWNSSEDGRYKKGNISWQTGLHGDAYKAHFTEESLRRGLEKISEMKKTKKIGDEVIIKGVPWIVTSLDYGTPYCDRRIPKRRYVWEQVHGKIPKDHCVICLDGNPMNCDPSNLYCMPIRYRTILAKNNWWFKSPELILTAIKWCELFCTIKDTRIKD